MVKLEIEFDGTNITLRDSRKVPVSYFTPDVYVNDSYCGPYGELKITSLSTGGIILYAVLHKGKMGFSIIPINENNTKLPDWRIFRKWNPPSEYITIIGPDDLKYHYNPLTSKKILAFSE